MPKKQRLGVLVVVFFLAETSIFCHLFMFCRFFYLEKCDILLWRCKVFSCSGVAKTWQAEKLCGQFVQPVQAWKFFNFPACVADFSISKNAATEQSGRPLCGSNFYKKSRLGITFPLSKKYILQEENKRSNSFFLILGFFAIYSRLFPRVIFLCH